MRCIVWCMLLLLHLCSGQIWAEDSTAEVVEPRPLAVTGEQLGNSDEQDAGQLAAVVPAKRDPFAVTSSMVVEQQKPKPKPKPIQPPLPSTVFTPGPKAQKMPTMRLRGHLTGGDGEVVALLEIEGGDVHIVREGDTVGLHDIGYDTVVRIKEISRLHLVVESGQLGQVIIVR